MSQGAQPYHNAAEHLQDHLDEVFLCLKRYVARYGYRMIQSGGRLGDLYVSMEEARALLDKEHWAEPTRRAPSPDASWSTALEVSQEVARRLVHKEARLTRTAHLLEPVTLPLEELRALFGLTEVQLRLLIAAAAPALSVDLARLYTFAWADFALKIPTVGFLAELVAAEPEQAPQLVAHFAPHGALARQRLVELHSNDRWGKATPLLHRGVTVPDSVVAYLQGRLGELPPELRRTARLWTPAQAPSRDLWFDSEARKRIQQALRRAVRGGLPRLALLAPRGSGRRSLLAQLMAQTDQGLLEVDMDDLARRGVSLEDAARALCREARLRRALLLLRMDELLDRAEAADEALRALGPVLADYEGPVALTARRSDGAVRRSLGEVQEIPVPAPEAEDRAALWSQAAQARQQELPRGLARSMARRFSLTPGAIEQAVQEAHAEGLLQARGPRAGQLEAALDSAVRRQLEHSLHSLAEPFSTSLQWEDVILDAETRQVLDEIRSHARNRDKVYDRWGFRRKMSYGRGLSCLFTGPPGTGKTTMAAVLGAELGREVYRIDLARVSSKWVGETEKNLSRVFEEAEKAQVILLFDEADSLFSSRTRVSSANDRFANMEINYLLQRMESYDGVTVLTTNFEQGIDEAFKRRIKFRVHFPLPDKEHRARMWETMLPVEAERAPQIDFEALGEDFELSGGNIRNAVLRAAFYAAEQDRPIHFDHLEMAAQAEAREMGQLIRGLDLDDY